MLGCYVVYALSVMGLLGALGLAVVVDTPDKLLRVLVFAVVAGLLGIGALIAGYTRHDDAL